MNRALASITAGCIATPLLNAHDDDDKTDLADPEASCGALPDDGIARPVPMILDWRRFRVAQLNHLIAQQLGVERAVEPQRIDYLLPYSSVREDMPLPALFGETGTESAVPPMVPTAKEVDFWVVVAASGEPTGTLTSDNLFKLPGRMYLLNLILRMERLAAEYCYRLPHLFWTLQQNRRHKTLVQSMNFDSRWWRDVDFDDPELLAPILRQCAARAADIQQRRIPLLNERDQLIDEILSDLRDDRTPMAGRRFAMRLLMESTSLRDRKNMLANAATLRPHRQRILDTFGQANMVRDRIVHPYPAMSTQHDRFWGFEDLEPLANEVLDEGLDQPMCRAWSTILEMETLQAVQSFTSSVLEITGILESAE